MTSVRTRFAPSPTGHVHIGNIRAAIYNWLFSRHAGGKFLLRVEDTDRERSTPEATQAVLDAMSWLGLNVDEEPLFQHTRKSAHVAAAEKLLAAGRAYKQDKGGTGKGEAVVFKMPGTAMTFRDEIKGEMRKEAENLPDFVILRSDGNPVFHLANVVDDIHQQVTHVIRGDDHVENTFRHIALYQALGAPPPKFAHLPMIVNAQGKPYSKRDGSAYVGDFRDAGYEAHALFNYLALVGWSPGEDRELMTREEMIQLFSLDRVKSHAAQFDVKKLQWMNGEYLQRAPDAEWESHFRSTFPQSSQHPEFSRVIALMKPRIKMWKDVSSAIYFFSEDFPFDPDARAKRLDAPGAKDLLKVIRHAYADAPAFDAVTLETVLKATAESRGLKPADLIHPVRVAVTGQPGGPSLYHLLEVIGRDRVLRRLDRASA